MPITLTIFTGMLTFTSLLTTFILGKFLVRGKPVLKYHKFFAHLTILLAVIHVSIVLKSIYF